MDHQKYDDSYVLTSLVFTRDLFHYDTEITSLELKLKPGHKTDVVQRKLQRLLGEDYLVQNRYEQQEDTFRIMEIEKLISYLFLTFILMVACCNIIGSLSMLILEKRNDVQTLANLGADRRLISRIFLQEGCLILILGDIIGVLLGLLLCYLQQQFGLISLGTEGGFVVSAYPVSVEVWDVVLVFFTVLIVGFLSIWYPVRYLSKRLLN